MTLNGTHARLKSVESDNRPVARRAEAALAPWQPSPRYADLPVSLRTRLFGMSGVGLVTLAVAAGMLLTWRVYSAAQAPAHLAVFNVAQPAAPPEPQSEMEPGPQQVQKDKAVKPDRPPIEVPEIQIPVSSAVMQEAPKPEVVDPGPPVEKTTAPESKPLPPAQQARDAKPTWEGLVLGGLNKVKRYPREASFRRQQGVPYIRFVMDREGKVLSVRLERSSGYRPLDDEAMLMPRRAQPLPKPPKEIPGDTIELVVPVEFFMR